MLFQPKMTPLEKEWAGLLKAEERFLKNKSREGLFLVQEKFENLKQVVPEKLQDTLKQAFYKAFHLIFERGTGMIEKTYSREKLEYTYKMNAYAAELKESRKNMRAFSKNARAANVKNLAVSGIEGIGTGFFGVGIPDIPLFTAMILKSIYEISASYGYRYDTEQEKWFILTIIKTALERGEALADSNALFNRRIDGSIWEPETGLEPVIRQTAYRLAEELLYFKFIQGIPVVGIAGGVSDIIYLKRITDYGELKYKRRFLTDRRKKETYKKQ